MNFLSVAFSTSLGAAVALAADRLTRLYDRRLREENALNSLILDLSGKRAFLVLDDWEWADGEVQRVVDSIHHARLLIRETRLTSRPRSKCLPHLRQMTRACNTFLEVRERVDPKTIKYALQTLTKRMLHGVEQLHSLSPRRILADSPGSFSLYLAD